MFFQGVEMEPTFNPAGFDHETELLCPSCGSNYLHHERVEIFERNEDEKKGIHIVVNDGEATIDTSLNGNPSKRRHGLTIYFSCENCNASPALSLAQHKGSTYINFKPNKET